MMIPPSLSRPHEMVEHTQLSEVLEPRESRYLICFAVGFIVLAATQNSDYDTRFALRGAQDVGEDVILIGPSRDDVTWIEDLKRT